MVWSAMSCALKAVSHPVSGRNLGGLVCGMLVMAGAAGLASASVPPGHILAVAAPAPGQNFFYTIDPVTGVATQQAPTPGGSIFSAIAADRGGRFFAYSNGAVFSINTTTWTLEQLAPAQGPPATGLDIVLAAPGAGLGTGYVIPTTGDVRLHSVNLSTGAATPLGPVGGVAAALDAFYGSGPNAPFIIGLGSVGTDLFGVHTTSGRTNLVRFNIATGEATPLGTPNNTPGSAGGGWTGFASMTGVDTDNNGHFDALFGGVNFLNGARTGAVARYNLADGTFELVNTNPSLIFFSMASSPRCLADWNADGEVEPADIAAFFSGFRAGDADVDNNGETEPLDITLFFAAYREGC
jgi:hypothetical protein